jgi:hypothetical protein
MSTDALAKLARTISREEFVAKHGSLYLVIADNLEALPIGFETAVVTFSGKRRRTASLDFEVLAIAKAPTNPYPDRISVGRARNCDVVMRDPSVSKLHAHFHLRDGSELDLVDLGSQNGTRVNGRVLVPHTPEWVTPGDVLLFGAVSAKLIDAEGLFELLQK